MQSVSRIGRVAAVGAVIGAIVLVAIVLFGAGGAGYTVTARFVNASQLVNGNLVQIGGTKAGSVEGIEITPDGQAKITMSIDEAAAPLLEGTTAVIRQASLSGIANRYVDLQLPPGDADTIPSGGELGADETTTPVEIDQIFNTFDPIARVAVQDTFGGLAEMFRGRGGQARRGYAYLNPALSTSSRLFRELDRDTQVLESFLVDSARLVTTLAERRDDLAALIGNLGATTRALGDQKLALAEAIARFPDFMRTANTTFVNLRSTLDTLDPLVGAAKPVVSRPGPGNDLQELLPELRQFTADAEPTVADLQEIIRKRGANNDLINLTNAFPPLESAALERKPRTVAPGGRRFEVGGGEPVRGAFPEMTEALKESTNEIAFARETIRRAHPGLRETSETLDILKNQTGVIKSFVSDSDTVVQQLADRKRDVARFVAEAGETAAITATRRDQLADQFRKLPTFLGELEPTMARLGDLADAQVPLLADLRAASGDLNRFFTELGPFAQATRPSLRTLGDVSQIGNRAFGESSDEIAQLRRLARKVPRLATPLRQFLVSLDDRGRGVERDTRAAATAPPPPDPTAANAIRGFTGFEAFVNYLFWQTLAINGYDDVSHFLRFLGIEDECTTFSVDPSKSTLERCNAYVGPNQPGVDSATGELNGRPFPGSQPDPTAGGSSGASDQSAGADRAGKRRGSASEGKRGGRDGGKHRGGARGGKAKTTARGRHAAGRTPKLPPVDRSLPGGRDARSGGSPQDPEGDPPPDQLLDFLLGP